MQGTIPLLKSTLSGEDTLGEFMDEERYLRISTLHAESYDEKKLEASAFSLRKWVFSISD